VLGVNGLTLTLSQPVRSGTGQSIWIQLQDGSVENFSFGMGVNANQIILGAAPAQPIVSDPRNFANPTYQIVSSMDTRTNAFLINENDPQENMLQQVKVVNYDDRYYAHDLDVIHGVITADAGQYDANGNYLGGKDGTTGGGLVNPVTYAPSAPAPPPTNKGQGFQGL
jgi:hypothetical protein